MTVGTAASRGRPNRSPPAPSTNLSALIQTSRRAGSTLWAPQKTRARFFLIWRVTRTIILNSVCTSVTVFLAAQAHQLPRDDLRRRRCTRRAAPPPARRAVEAYCCCPWPAAFWVGDLAPAASPAQHRAVARAHAGVALLAVATASLAHVREQSRRFRVQQSIHGAFHHRSADLASCVGTSIWKRVVF